MRPGNHKKWGLRLVVGISQFSMAQNASPQAQGQKKKCLSIPNVPGSLLENRVFDPFLTHFWSQSGPFARHYGIFHGPKRVTKGSKLAKKTCLSTLNSLGSLLGKCVFHPMTHFEPFLVPKRPVFKAYWDFAWAKMRHHGHKTGYNPPNAPQMVRDHFWKHAFLTHLRTIFGPKMAHFQGILGFYMCPNVSPRA